MSAPSARFETRADPHWRRCSPPRHHPYRDPAALSRGGVSLCPHRVTGDPSRRPYTGGCWTHTPTYVQQSLTRHSKPCSFFKIASLTCGFYALSRDRRMLESGRFRAAMLDKCWIGESNSSDVTNRVTEVIPNPHSPRHPRRPISHTHRFACYSDINTWHCPESVGDLGKWVLWETHRFQSEICHNLIPSLIRPDVTVGLNH